VNQVAFQFAQEKRLFLQDNKLVMAGSALPSAILEVKRWLGHLPPTEILSEADFDTRLQTTYSDDKGSSAEVMENLGDVLDIQQAAMIFEEKSDLLMGDDDAPIIRLLNSIFFDALKKHASDIHIEPYEKTTRVRFRLDGTLQVVLEPPLHVAPRLISRIKVLAKLNIAEKRIPQDGRITIQLGGRPIDLRVSTLPSMHGERVVLRLLEKQASHVKNADLGMSSEDQATLDELVSRPHGILLVTGPTGSGKTTTLYAALQSLNQYERNIMTVEDPVEYDLPGISQTQISGKAGMTFAKGLRAILRQDPDVILVGEIRDQETADIATQASLTGHLVLSTLHTNTAAGAVTRMQDIGVDSYLLASTLRGVIAQRLIRLLCPHCKIPVAVDEGTRARFTGLPCPEHIFEPQGCTQCGQSGYMGRRALFEVVTITSAMQQLIHDQAGEIELETEIRQRVESLYQQGLKQVIHGHTSLEEVLRVTAL
jgi:general secretion pathway protein E